MNFPTNLPELSSPFMDTRKIDFDVCFGPSLIPGVIPCPYNAGQELDNRCGRCVSKYRAALEKAQKAEALAKEKESQKLKKEEVRKICNTQYDNDGTVYPITEDEITVGYDCKMEIDEELAAKIFIETMTRRHRDGKKVDILIKRDGDILCVFDESTGIWDTDINCVKTKIMESNLRFYPLNWCTKNETWIRAKKCINYSGSIGNVEKLYKYLETNRKLIPNEKFIENNIETNIGKLLFKNGIYDFDTGKFTEGFNPDIIFFHKMERNFPERKEDDIKYLEEILFTNLFENTNVSGYLKKAITLAIYGNYKIRKAIIAIGKTASGKGMIIKMLTKTFPGLVKTFNANNFIYKESNKDEAQQNMFLIQYKTSRLILSSEVRISKNSKGEIKTLLDGNMFKSVVSGGDEIEVRGMKENIYQMTNRSTLIFCANDFPEFYPIDNAVKDRIENVSFCKSFVENPDPKNPLELKRDITIKDKILEEKYQDALFWILADTYTKEIKGKDYQSAPKEIDENEEDMDVSEIELFDRILMSKYDLCSEDVMDRAVIKIERRVENRDIDLLIGAELGWTKRKITSIFKDFRRIKNLEFKTLPSNGKSYRGNIVRKEIIVEAPSVAGAK
jgi:hypothetical protein